MDFEDPLVNIDIEKRGRTNKGLVLQNLTISEEFRNLSTLSTLNWADEMMNHNLEISQKRVYKEELMEELNLPDNKVLNADEKQPVLDMLISTGDPRCLRLVEKMKSLKIPRLYFSLMDLGFNSLKKKFSRDLAEQRAASDRTIVSVIPELKRDVSNVETHIKTMNENWMRFQNDFSEKLTRFNSVGDKLEKNMDLKLNSKPIIIIDKWSELSIKIQDQITKLSGSRLKVVKTLINAGSTIDEVVEYLQFVKSLKQD